MLVKERGLLPFNINGFVVQVCDVPLEVMDVSTPFITRNIQLTVESMYGFMGGLQYFDLTGKTLM